MPNSKFVWLYGRFRELKLPLDDSTTHLARIVSTMNITQLSDFAKMMREINHENLETLEA
jgi:hypothetical protein